jgi:hypothetical protein
MKAFFFYLLSRLKKSPISWTQAKVDASRISVRRIIEIKLDNFCLRVLSFYLFIKINIFVKGTLKLDLFVQQAYAQIVKTFIGRLFICFCRGKTDYRFLFKGVEQ